MIQFTDVRKLPDKSWLFTWPASAPQYRVVLFGFELARTTSTSYTYDLDNYPLYPPPVEVVPVGELSQSELYPAFVTVQWYRGDGVDNYTVTEKQGAGPFLAAADYGGDASWAYTHATAVKADGTLVTLRVTPYNELGDAGDYLEFQETVVCQPPPVMQNLFVTYDEMGGQLIIAGL